MKQFKRHRSLEELKAECKKRRWKINTKRHDEDGHDHVKFDFKVKTLGGPVKGHVLFNTFNGRFFGEVDYGKGRVEQIDSSKTTHDHCLWFKTLLETAYTN